MNKVLSILSVITILSIQTIYAEKAVGFKRIDSVDQIESGANYVVMALDAKGVGHVMTSELRKGTKLESEVVENLSDSMFFSYDIQLWNIVLTEKGYTFQADNTANYIASGKGDTDVNLSNKPLYWTLEQQNSVFICKSTEHPQRRLAYSPGVGTSYNYFGLYLINSLGYHDLTLYKEFYLDIPPADSTLDSGGMKRLLGGWSGKQLAAVSFDGVTELDLTNISFWPAGTLPFSNQKSNSNVIIYVNEIHRNKIHKDWKNVVICSEKGNYLAKPMTIHDKEPLHISRSFHVGKDSLTYTRDIIDINWETLYIPFSVIVTPSEFSFHTINKIENYNITLNEISNIEAFQPLLIKRKQGSKRTTLTLSSQEQEIAGKNHNPPNNGLIGTTFHKTIETETGSVFLLNAEGTNFVKAAPTSFLTPFRCFLVCDQEAGDSKTISLSEDNITLVQTPSQNITTTVYSLDGTLVGKGKTWNEIAKDLPRGLYIEKNRIRTKQ